MNLSEFELPEPPEAAGDTALAGAAPPDEPSADPLHGPWCHDPKLPYFIREGTSYSFTGHAVAAVYGQNGSGNIDDPVAHARTRLITAAPKLLALTRAYRSLLAQQVSRDPAGALDRRLALAEIDDLLADIAGPPPARPAHSENA